MEQSPPAVLLQDVKKSFPLGHGHALEVLNVTSLALPVGSHTVLKGPSGSGKTTLLNLIAGITLPTAGRIQVNGADLVPLPEPQRDRFRAAHIGYVFQTFNLLAPFTALENVMLPLEFNGASGGNGALGRATYLLKAVGLADRCDHYPAQLSGGEQQRVALARAFVMKPSVLLADEPTGNLDSENGRHVLDLLIRLNREEGTTLILVTHDELLASHAERRILLRDGQVVEDLQ